VAAYRAPGETGFLPKSTELLYGFVYKKMSKSPFHSALVRRLLRLLKQAGLPGCFVDSEQPITCGNSEPEPDIAVLRGVEEDFWNDHPHTAELVIEVCISSHDYDRSKLRAYASAGVKECWLVPGPEKKIEVYREPQDDRFLEQTVHGPGGTLTSSVLAGFTLSLDSLFDR
jgi:Uma2 family endonuclease